MIEIEKVEKKNERKNTNDEMLNDMLYTFSIE